MFYSFSQLYASQRPSAHYQEFLQQEGVTLEQILAHEDTVAELRKGNRDLLNYARLQVPALLECLDEQGGKAPFVAAEILTSESLMNEMSSECLPCPLFFHFLQAPSPLNDTVAGYHVRTCLKLLERQEAKVTDFILASSQPWTGLLLGHLKTKAVAELVFELLCVNRMAEERQSLLRGVVERLVDTQDRQIAVNVGWVGTEIMRKSDSVCEWKRLVGVLLSGEVLQGLAGVITSDIAGDQTALVLSTLISHFSFPQLLEAMLVSPSKQSSFFQALTHLLEIALNYLETPIASPSSPTSYGQTAPPLGTTRLHILELVLSCMKSIGSAIDPLLQSTHFLETTTKLFLTYPWHSRLHLAYANIIKTALEGPSTVLKSVLMEDVRLVELLACLGSACEEGKHRKGYMGQITQIGNTLLSVSGRNVYFRDFLKVQIWTDFCQFYLFPQTKLENMQFLSAPKSPSEDELDDFPSGEEKKTEERPLTLEELDQQNPFDLWGDEDTAILEEPSDLYNAANYWKVPINSGELEDLE